MNNNCCPYCCSPIGKITEYHSINNDKTKFYICIVCESVLTEEEYIALIEDE